MVLLKALLLSRCKDNKKKWNPQIFFAFFVWNPQIFFAFSVWNPKIHTTKRTCLK